MNEATPTRLADQAHALDSLVLRACGEADCVVLFGSRAAECSEATSDIDLLCVGHGMRVKTTGVDILWITPDRLKGKSWLGSELASHIGAYGRCVRGRAEWLGSTFVSEQAVNRKIEAVRRRAAAIRFFGPQLDERRLVSYVRRLRRDVQRLEVLRAGVGVPATPMLDAQWSRFDNAADWMVRTLDDIRVQVSDALMRGCVLDAEVGGAGSSSPRCARGSLARQECTFSHRSGPVGTGSRHS